VAETKWSGETGAAETITMPRESLVGPFTVRVFNAAGGVLCEDTLEVPLLAGGDTMRISYAVQIRVEGGKFP
jgi:hypothetical protein